MPAQPVDATPSDMNLFSKGGVYHASETGEAFMPRPKVGTAVADVFGSGARWGGYVLEVALLYVLVEAPSLNLVENFRNLLLRNWLVNEAFATPETAEVPWTGLKFGWLG